MEGGGGGRGEAKGQLYSFLKGWAIRRVGDAGRRDALLAGETRRAGSYIAHATFAEADCIVITRNSRVEEIESQNVQIPLLLLQHTACSIKQRKWLGVIGMKACKMRKRKKKVG